MIMERNFFLALAFCAGTAFFVSGCSMFNSKEVTVTCNETYSQQQEYFRNELVNDDGLTRESENFLRGNLMLDNLDDNPELILKKLNEYYKISHHPKYLTIASDLCRYLATRTDDKTNAIRYDLSCFLYSTSYIRALRKTTSLDDQFYDFSASQNLQNYNGACRGIFTFLKERNLLDADSVTLKDIEGHSIILAKPDFRLSVPREAIEDFSLCASYTVRNLMQMNRQTGIGIPLVAKIKVKQWHKSLKTPIGLTIPVTLLLKRVDGPKGENFLRLVFIDTSVCEEIQTQFENYYPLKYPLALDFSTPLAVFLDNVTEKNLLKQMLNAFEQEERDGLYMIEPYQPNKIPVVFVHGLMSSPETWVQMINSLKNDPSIRKRYQFWLFSYSTGSPVIFSAKKLRVALQKAEQEFCTTPEATENFNRMVIVGHSMGGLLTRMQIQKYPYYIYETATGMKKEQIIEKLQPDDWKYMDSFTPYPLPFVHRVVFIAVPHRGADMAETPIAQLGIDLIKLPASVLHKETTIKRITRTLGASGNKLEFSNRFFTGIDNLKPDNGLVRAIGSSPMKDDLVYHSIIGNLVENGTPGNSDGVVPYWSSHLDNAASELVVKSNHSVHRRPMAIQELLRILLLHLDSIDKKTASK